MLDEDLEANNSPEDWVVKQSLEHIDFFGFDNSAVDHIEQVHEYESVEANSVKDETVGWKTLLGSKWSVNKVEGLSEEDETTEVHKDKHDDQLVKGLSEDLSPHLFEDNLVLSADS